MINWENVEYFDPNVDKFPEGELNLACPELIYQLDIFEIQLHDPLSAHHHFTLLIEISVDSDALGIADFRPPVGKLAFHYAQSYSSSFNCHNTAISISKIKVSFWLSHKLDMCLQQNTLIPIHPSENKNEANYILDCHQKVLIPTPVAI